MITTLVQHSDLYAWEGNRRSGIALAMRNLQSSVV